MAAASTVDDIETFVVVDGDSMKYVNHEKNISIFSEKKSIFSEKNRS